MANNAAFGAILAQFDTTSGYVTIAQVDDIKAPALALEMTDVTSHSSASGWREVIGGLKAIGEISMTLIFDPAGVTHVSQWTALDNREHEIFRMTFPDAGGTTWAFRAFVTGFEPGAAVGEKLTASVTMLGTGAPKLESDFDFLVDETGAYLVDGSGNVLIIL